MIDIDTGAPERRARPKGLGRSLGAGALAAIMAVAGLQGAANAQDLRTLTIAQGSSSFHGMMTLVAREGGFFEAEGLNPDIVDMGTGPRIAAAVVGGSAHIAVVGLNQAVRAVSEGGDIVGLGRAFEVLAVPIVVSYEALERNGITEDMTVDEAIPRLAGLTLGSTTPGSTNTGVLRALLENRGVDPDNDVTVQSISGGGNIFAAFENGVIDGFVFGSPWPELAMTRGLGRPIFNPFEDDVPELDGVLYQVLTTSRATLAAEPELIRAGMRAYANAMKFTHENPQEAARLLRSVFPEVEEESFELAVATYIGGVPTQLLITPENYAATLGFMAITEPEPVGDVPMDSVVDTTLASEIDAEMAQ